jgi:hypothetical protein
MITSSDNIGGGCLPENLRDGVGDISKDIPAISEEVLWWDLV